jgi:hypothetical protein
VAVVLSGGNVDINMLARVAEHGLMQAGRFQSHRARRQPPALAVVGHLDAGANVLSVAHHRSRSLPVGACGSCCWKCVTASTREVAQALERAGFARRAGGTPGVHTCGLIVRTRRYEPASGAGSVGLFEAAGGVYVAVLARLGRTEMGCGCWGGTGRLGGEATGARSVGSAPQRTQHHVTPWACRSLTPCSVLTAWADDEILLTFRRQEARRLLLISCISARRAGGRTSRRVSFGRRTR